VSSATGALPWGQDTISGFDVDFDFIVVDLDAPISEAEFAFRFSITAIGSDTLFSLKDAAGDPDPTNIILLLNVTSTNVTYDLFDVM
jgi:hypothetical protein